MSSRFDVIVVGGGPAGSIAAFVLARGGAKVALVDKAKFPRDKACGDIVGPRGLQVLDDLGLPRPIGPDVGEIMLVGQRGRRAQLPCGQGLTYPGHGTAVTRTVFDSMLHDAAVEAGASSVQAQVVEPLESEGRIDGYRSSSGTDFRADFVIGADGATSRVAGTVGMVDAKKVLWGFAMRTYLPHAVDLPAIVLWEPESWRGFPGYGWVFPGTTGIANVGLGLGTVANGARGRGSKRLCRASSSTCASWSSLGTLRPACQSVAWAAGSRWAWSARVRPQGRCSSWATRPALSTRCKVRESPRRCAAVVLPPKRSLATQDVPQHAIGPTWRSTICRITASPPRSRAGSLIDPGRWQQ